MPIADGSTSGAPWWGVPIIAGIFLIIGGGLGFLSTTLSDRRRARFESGRAAETEALETTKVVRTFAATLLVESRNFYEAYKANFVVNEQGKVVPAEQPTSLDFSAAHHAYWELAFAASEEVRALARELHEATRSFNRFRPNHEVRPFDPDAWRIAQRRYYLARQQLVESLTGVPGGASSESI